MEKYHSSSFPYKNVGKIAFFLKMMLLIYFICLIFSVIASYEFLELYSEKSILLPTDMQTSQMDYWGLAADIVFFIIIICYCLWLYRIYQNMYSFGFDHYLRMTPGWAVGWYFVPIANFYKPYQGMKDVWDACDTGNEKKSTSSLIKWWWIFFVSSFITFRFIINPPTKENIIFNMKIDIALTLFDFLSIVSVYLLIHKLSKKQEQTYQSLGSSE
ncbi:DUF4328 domain-containing protein [Shimazuella kribbensis]|uniref:DUF4328 domain-containing protein n=1 Tax=Shimazuella kribbensis TaxID=139808 RepID=UPI000419680B|nr:DUF4328 domain-containing protein [Shimazuella kribbensis]